MEQHPVPQDIKSFQFRLVGDMTIRQFAFLAGGAAIAYIIFVLKIPTYIKYPLVVLFAGGGAATAFVPINERPLDRWLIAFVRAIFGTTRRVWLKSGQPPEFFIHSYALATSQQQPIAFEDRQRLDEYLANLPPKPADTVDQDERDRLEKIDFTIGEMPAGAQKTGSNSADDSRPSLAAQAAPTTKVLQVRNLNGEEKLLPQLTGVRVRKLGSATPRGEIVLAKTPPSSQTPVQSAPPPTQAPAYPAPKPPPALRPVPFPSQPPGPEPTELFSSGGEALKKAQVVIAAQTELDESQALVKRLEAEKQILTERAKEERERAERFKKEVARQQEATPTPPGPFVPSEATGQTQTQAAAPPLTSQPLPPPAKPLRKLVLPTMTDTPNVINGIVADREGNLLENAIIVVKDRDGTPVRALKSNTLGQFAISTPLRNGTYSIEVEKEGYSFNPIYQEIAGTVLPPLEIRSQA